MEEVLPIDVWFMAILLKEGLQTFQIERFLSRRMYKLSAGTALFETAVKGNGTALLPIFKNLIQLEQREKLTPRIGEILAKSSSPRAQELAQSLFVACWHEFKYPFYQQEVMGVSLFHF